MITQDASTPAVVDATGSTAAAVTTASFSPPAGCLAVITVNIGFAANQPITPAVTVADSLGNTYTAGPAAYDGAAVGTWHFTYAYATAPGSITVTATRDQTAAALFELYPRILAGAAASQAAAATARFSASTAGTAASAAISPAAAGSYLVVSSCQGSTEGAVTPVSGTSVDAFISDATDGKHAINGHLLTPLTAITPGWTIPTAAAVAWAALEILPASPPPFTIVQTAIAPNALTLTLPAATRQGSALFAGIPLGGGTNIVPAVSAVSIDGHALTSQVSRGGATNTAQNGYYAGVWALFGCPAGLTTITVTATSQSLNTSTGVCALEVAAVNALDGSSANNASANAWTSNDAAMTWPYELAVGCCCGGFGNNNLSFLTGGAASHQATGMVILNRNSEGLAYLFTGTPDGATVQYKGTLTGTNIYNWCCVAATFPGRWMAGAGADLGGATGTWTSPGNVTADDGTVASWAVT